MNLLVLFVSVLLAVGCSKESMEETSVTPGSPKPVPPIDSDETTLPTQGLAGSVWTGEGQSGDGLLTYVFQFSRNAVTVTGTCHVDESSSTLNSDLAAIYSDNGNTVELKSGVQSKIPAGQGSCTLNFPAGLKFQLSNDQIFIEYGGNRRPTEMKRQN